MQIGPENKINVPAPVFVAKKTEPKADVPEQKVQNPKQESSDKENTSTAYEFIRKAIPLPGAIISSLIHLYAFGSHLIKPGSNERQAADSQALNVSKVTLVANCLLQTYEALKKNRAVEAFSRFIEPLFIVAEKRVEDLGLARGIGLGISQLVGSQEGIFNELAKQKLGYDPTQKNETRVPTLGQDLDLNVTAFKKLFAENVKGGIGKGRRFLTGLTPSNIKAKFSEFRSKFNLGSVKELLNSEHGDYRERFKAFLNASGLQSIKELFQGNEKLDKGHTDALSGYLMIAGSLLGYMDKASKGILYKLGGTIRNLGGTVADIGLFGHKDPDFNISSMFLSVNTFMDIVQRFIPEKMLNIILPWSNFSMAAYNVGVAIYLNRSNKKSNEGDEIEYHDTDLKNKVAQPDLKEDYVKSAAELLAMAA